VHAHAGFKEAITEGTANTWNAVTVTHGCASNAGGETTNVPHKDVVSLSVVFPDFPHVSNVIMRGSKGAVPAQGGDGVTTPGGTGTVGDETVIGNLADHIEGATGTVALNASLSLDTGGDQMFPNTIPVVDGNGNVRGWQGWNGPKPFKGPALLETFKKPDGSDVSTTGLSPFRISGIKFKETSCAKALKIRVAVANWCGSGNKANKKPENVADIWIGEMTSKFNDQATMPNASTATGGNGAIYWPTITVNRDLDENPLPGNCDADTAYDTVYIEPTKADIDAMLPISKKKYPKGAGQKFWPSK
jgi:hypothetical protein